MKIVWLLEKGYRKNVWRGNEKFQETNPGIS